MKRCSIGLLFCLLLPGWGFGYGQSEILNILMTGIKSHDAAVAKAVVILRKKGLMEAQFGDLPKLAAIAETAEAQAALGLLFSRGLLPEAQTSPKALSEYLGQVNALSEEEARERAREPERDRQKVPLLCMGQVTRVAPYYVYLSAQKQYILGGMVQRGTEVEMTYARPDGFAEVIFPSIKRGLINKDYLEPVSVRATTLPGDVTRSQTLAGGRVRYWESSFNGAELYVLQVDSSPDGQVTLSPFVTSYYNRARPGPVKVDDVLAIARKSGSLAAINGTFFINTPSSTYHGTPLAPIIIDGQPVWSHDELRVRNMNRAYLAVTNSNRVVMGETTLLAPEILALNRRGEFNPEHIGREPIRHLMGGVGWLIRDGDADAWRKVAGRQFGYSYYSYFVRRPQTAVACSGDGRRVWLIVQEGKPHSERPLSLPELCTYIHSTLRAPWAVFFDGGGSSEMVLNGDVVTRQEGNKPYRKNSTALLVMQSGR